MWFEDFTKTPVQRHPCYEHRRGNARYVVRSKTVADASGQKRPLPDRHNGFKDILRYDHFRTLRASKAWRVPLLLGKSPSCPQKDSTAQEKGMYALYMMMLFRPWRRPSAALRTWLGDLQAESAHERPSADQVWTKLFEEFLQWRQHIKEVAAPYFRRYWPQDAPGLDRPPHDTSEYWACMVYLRLSNLELTLSRKKSVKGTAPSHFDGLPFQEYVCSDGERWRECAL